MQTYRSLLAPTGVGAARGIAYIEDPNNPGNAKLADGSLPIAGFVTRNIQVGGPTLGDSIYPLRIELPFQDGTQISLEQAEMVSAEGYDPTTLAGNLYSGTGVASGTGLNSQITAATPTGTRCSFLNGQFCVAGVGQYTEFYLAAFEPPALPQDTFRCRFVRTAGQVR
jgi:hypothetical protein